MSQDLASSVMSQEEFDKIGETPIDTSRFNLDVFNEALASDKYSLVAGTDIDPEKNKLVTPEVLQMLQNGATHLDLYPYLGPYTNKIIEEFTQNQLQYQNDSFDSRGFWDKTLDAVNSAGASAVDSLITTGIGLANVADDAPEATAIRNQALQNARKSDWIYGENGSVLSNELLDAQRAAQARIDRENLANTKIFQEELKKLDTLRKQDKDTVLGSLRDIGRKTSVISGHLFNQGLAYTNNTPLAVIGNDISSGIGSLLPSMIIGGGTGKLIGGSAKLVADKLVSKSVKEFIKKSSAGKAIKHAPEMIGWGIANTAMESLSAQEQAREEILAMNPADLIATSKRFNEICDELEKNKSIEKDNILPLAQNILANEVAQRVAEETAPVAAGSSIISNRINKLLGSAKPGFTRSAIDKTLDTLAEGGEEYTIGAFSTYFTNKAKQDLVDSSQDVFENVGTEGMRGAVAGAGTGASMNIPGTLREGYDKTKVKIASSAPVKAASEAINEKLDSVQAKVEANKQAKEITEGYTQEVSQELDDMNASIQETSDILNTEPESTESTKNDDTASVLDSFKKIYKENATLSEEESKKTKSTDAIVEFKSQVDSLEESLQKNKGKVTEESEQIAQNINKLYNKHVKGVFDNLDSFASEVEAMDDSDSNKKQAQKIINSLIQLRDNTQVQNIIAHAEQTTKNKTEKLDKKLHSLSKKESVDVKEIQQTLSDYITAVENGNAKSLPFKKEETVDNLLKNQDKLQLTDEQKTFLKQAKKLKDIKRNLNSPVNEFTLSAVADPKRMAKYSSSGQLSKENTMDSILNDLGSKNTVSAKNKLRKLGNWVKSINNLFAGISDDGSEFSFKSYDPVADKFYTATNKGINTKSDKDKISLITKAKHATNAALVYNSLVQMYPELNLPQINIDEVLNKVPDKDVADKYQKNLDDLNKTFNVKPKVESDKDSDVDTTTIQDTQNVTDSDENEDDTSGVYADNTLEKEEEITTSIKPERLIFIDGDGKEKLTVSEADMSPEEQKVVDYKRKAFKREGSKNLPKQTQNLFNKVFSPKVKSIALALTNPVKEFLSIAGDKALVTVLAAANGRTNPLRLIRFNADYKDRFADYKINLEKFAKTLTERVNLHLNARLANLFNNLDDDFFNQNPGLKASFSEMFDNNGKLKKDFDSDDLVQKLQEIFTNPDTISQEDFEKLLLIDNSLGLLALVTYDSNAEKGKKFKFNEQYLDIAILTLWEHMLNAGANSSMSDETINELYPGASPSQKDLLKKSVTQENLLKSLVREYKNNLGIKRTLDSRPGESDAILASLMGEVLLSTINTTDTKVNGEFVKRENNIPYWVKNKDIHLYTVKNGNNYYKAYVGDVLFDTKLLKINGNYVTVLRPNKSHYLHKNIGYYSPFKNYVSTVLSEEKNDNEYYMDDPIQTDRNHMHSNIPLQKYEREAIAKANETKYYKDKRKFNILRSLKHQGIIMLFGTPISQAYTTYSDTETTTFIKGKNKSHFNEADLESIDGFNNQLIREYDILEEENSIFESISQETGIPFDEVYRRYRHSISVVGRLQQDGSATAQGSKLVRMVNKPTVSKDLDLTVAENKQFLDIALAQGLGIKVNNLSYSDIEAKMKIIYDKLNKPEHARFKELTLKMSNGLDMSIKDLNEFKQCLDNFVKDTGVDSGLVGFDTLMETVLYVDAIDKGETTFTTYAYIEADGVTNGVMMSMLMNTIGGFNQQWLDIIAKGGFTFEGEPITKAQIMTDPRFQKGNIDFYETVSSNMERRITEMFQKDYIGESNKEFRRVLGGTLSLLSRFYRPLTTKELITVDVEDITQEQYDNGVIGISRGGVKKGVTQNVYFAGSHSIAVGAINEMSKKVNKLCTKVLTNAYNKNFAKNSPIWQNFIKNNTKHDPLIGKVDLKIDDATTFSEQELAIAMYYEDTGNPAVDEQNAINQFTRLKTELELATSKHVVKYKGKIELSKENPSFNLVQQLSTVKLIRTFDFKNNLSQAQTYSLVKNIQESFSEHLTETTKELYGSETKQAINGVLSSAAIQTAMYRGRQIVELLKIPKNPLGMSLRERDEAMSNADKHRGKITTPRQTLVFDKTQAQDTFKEDNHSATLSNQMQYADEIPLASNPGARPGPQINQAFGDSTMVNAALHWVEEILPVFDGINMAIKNIGSQAVKMNKAVLEALKNNQYRLMQRRHEEFLRYYTWKNFGEVLNAYKKYFTNLDEYKKERDAFLLDGIPTDTSEYKAIKQILDNAQNNNKGLTVDDFKAIYNHKVALIKKQINDFKTYADEVEARVYALEHHYMSVDQMAGAGKPYVTGTDARQEITDIHGNKRLEDPVETLNRLFNEKLNELRNKPYTEINPGDLKPVSYLNLEKEMNKVAGGNIVYQALKKNGLTNVKVVLAKNLNQLVELANQEGIDTSAITRDNRVKAFYDPNTNTIWAIDNNPTDKRISLLHELVHAATFKLAYTYVTDKSKLTKTQVEALDRIQELMQEFVDYVLDPRDPRFSVKEASAFYDVQNKVREALNNGNLAVAINEYMAYGLSHPEVSSVMKQIKTTKTKAIAQATFKAIEAAFPSAIVNGIKNAIKQLKIALFGTDKVSISNSMFSQLQVNTVMLVDQTINQNTNTIDNITTSILFRTGNKNDPETQRLADLRSSLVEQLKQKVSNLSFDEKLIHVLNKSNLDNELDLVMNSIVQRFNWNSDQENTARALIETIQTAVNINQDALIVLKEIYKQVQEQVSFKTMQQQLKDPYLKEKYDTLFGLLPENEIPNKYHLAVFIAIASVDPNIRSILDQVTHNQYRKSGNTLSNKVNNALYNMFYDLCQTGAGTSKERNALEALDALAKKLIRNSKTPLMMDVPGQAKADEIAEGLLDKVFEGTQKTIEYIAKKTNIPTLGKLAKAFKTNQTSIEIINNAMQKARIVPQAGKDLISDIAGRTHSNATAYDLIKVVRSQVQRARNELVQQFPIILRSLFKNKVPKEDMEAMSRVLSKIDLSAFGIFSEKNLNLIFDRKLRNQKKQELLKTIKDNSPYNHTYDLYIEKCKELASYMVTGKNTSNRLLRNAEAIARLLGYNETVTPNEDLVIALDQLISIYCIEQSDSRDIDVLQQYMNTDKDAVIKISAALFNIQDTEKIKASESGIGSWNYQKGYLPYVKQSKGSIIVANKANKRKLESMGFKMIEPYNVNRADNFKELYYFYSPLTSPQFNEGVIQTVTQTAGGVDVVSGFSLGYTGGRIVKAEAVKRITKSVNADIRTKRNEDTEKYVPIFDEDGNIYAYERSIDPDVIDKLASPNKDITDLIGRQLGRQREEELALEVNKNSIDTLWKMWRDAKNKNTFINVYDIDDPLIKESLSMFPPMLRLYLEEKYGKEKFFMVPRDLVEDIVGVRMASVKDIYTGNSRLPDALRKSLELTFKAILGNNGYKYLKTMEQWNMAMMSYARSNIVVKSVLVPTVNIIGNVIQLTMAGVPPWVIATEARKKVAELEHYFATQKDIMELEGKIYATTNYDEKKRYQAQIVTLKNSYQGMQSIAPLLKAGEMSSIADLGIRPDEVELTDGQLGNWVEGKIEMLPEPIKTLAKYGLITKDTTMYQALEKSVQYGDFVAKAILYDHLTKKKNYSNEEALARIKEEFIDYDKYRGRARQYAEAMGVLWFMDYKIRALKVAGSLIRHNPLSVLLMSHLPAFIPIDGVGTVISDNIIAKIYESGIGSLFGYDMFWRSFSMNPWVALFF